jgi:colicin import membrane protein
MPAGILALVVHIVFFALLYFGFNWNRQAFVPPTMSVELWPSLPEQVVAPPPRIEEVVPPPPPQAKVVQPDIVIPDKKAAIKPVESKPEIKKPEIKKPVQKPVEAIQPKPVTVKPTEDPEARRIADEQAAKALAGRIRQEEQAAASGKVVDEYTAKITAKIRRNVVMPPDVPNDARAEFLVTLLPGGSVLPPRLVKSSGNTAYDNAVERAILKSDPLPLPPDVQLFNRFRELRLAFKPVE